MTELSSLVGDRIRDIPDFPEPGIVFKDITPLLADGPAWATLVGALAESYAGRVDLIAGIEARGFILGAPIASALGVGFVPVRKAGKLPGATRGVSYDLEYGSARIEIHEDALVGGERVLLVDDLLATGGTAAAAVSLLRGAGAHVVGLQVLIELTSLQGRAALEGVDLAVVLSV